MIKFLKKTFTVSNIKPILKTPFLAVDAIVIKKEVYF